MVLLRQFAPRHLSISRIVVRVPSLNSAGVFPLSGVYSELLHQTARRAKVIEYPRSQIEVSTLGRQTRSWGTVGQRWG